MANGFEGLTLSYEAIGEILKSDAVMNVCIEKAEEYNDDGLKLVSFVGFDRCHAHLYRTREENND